MYVQMAVKCVGKMCQDCPRLDLTVDRYFITDGFHGEEFNNAISCTNYKMCENIYNMIEKELTKEDKES